MRCSVVCILVRTITGKPSASPIRHLKVNNVEVSDFPDIANTIAQTFSNNSSPENYSNKFQSFRRQAENQQLKFKSSNWKLQQSILLGWSHWWSHDLMIQLLARMMSTTTCLNTSLMMLCSLYSTFLITSGLRENSLQAGVLLQLYQFLNLVDTFDPSNYRPIALTSCICKVMERIINSCCYVTLVRALACRVTWRAV